ncbi:MAG: hypothetical protein M1836_006015 [Candelina mexicana]|nr:MAG: hypothetical protein M1836_006015 [Candelina mexicana]
MLALAFPFLHLAGAALALLYVSAQEPRSPGPDRQVPNEIYPSGPLLYNEIYQPVQDPGFENNSEIEQTEPWVTLGWARINTDPALARNGTQSILFNATLHEQELDFVDFIHAFGLKQLITVYPGFVYTFQFWAKTIPNPKGASSCTMDVCLDSHCTFLSSDPGSGPLAQRGPVTQEWSYYKRIWQVPGRAASTGKDRQLIVPFPPANRVPEPVKSSFTIYAARCFAYVLIDDITLDLDPYQYLST